jgi:hypothetical protein
VLPGQAWQEDSAAPDSVLLQCPSLPDSTHALLHINPAKVKLQQHGKMRDQSLTFIHSSSSANTAAASAVHIEALPALVVHDLYYCREKPNHIPIYEITATSPKQQFNDNMMTSAVITL